MRPSTRLPPAHPNALSRAVAARRARGTPVVDLTVSNPTRVGLAYPPALLAPLGDARGLAYDPAPLGLARAREAVAADYARRDAVVAPERVALAPSTSDAYGWLFKLLCDPGDAVLVPRPSYPLFEHLTRLEGVVPVPYDLRYDGRWELDAASLERAPDRTRAVVGVSPNNPTGSFLSPGDFDLLAARCRARGWPLVLDEVFADYALDGRPHATEQGLARPDLLTFTLGGFSKTLGLPQLKLGWVVVAGPDDACRQALAALELVADSYLSVATPVQEAAAALLSTAAPVREAIRGRTRETLAAVRDAVVAQPACDLLPVEGGWSAVVRVPATRGEERLVVEAVEEDGVLVHPGYFFDFAHEAFVVVSLLVEPAVMAEGLPRVLARAAG